MTAIKSSGLLAWLHLVRVYDKMHHHAMDHLIDYGLTPAQFDVLAQLWRNQGINQQELAGKLLVTKGNVCGLIDRLEKLSLVERRSDPEDKRTNLLYLTEAGRKLADEAIPAHEAFILEHIGTLTHEEQASLLSILRNLDHKLDHH